MVDIPDNWIIGSQDARHIQWKPEQEKLPVAETSRSEQVVRQISKSVGRATATDLSSQMLTLPSLKKWRQYWTENGQQDCGGWFLRHVDGFVYDE